MFVELLRLLHHQWCHLGLGSQSSGHLNEGSTLRRRTKETNRLSCVGHVRGHLASVHIFSSTGHLGEDIRTLSEVVPHHRLECTGHTNGFFITQHSRLHDLRVGHHLADALLGQLLTGIHHQAGMELQLGVHVAAHIRLTVCTFTEHHTLHEVEHCTHCRLELLQTSDLAQLGVSQHVCHELIHCMDAALRGSQSPTICNAHVFRDLQLIADHTDNTSDLLTCCGTQVLLLFGGLGHELKKHTLHFQRRLTNSIAPLGQLPIFHGQLHQVGIGQH